MVFSQESIEMVLTKRSGGLKVDDLLKELHVEKINENRICLVSTLQWNPKIIHRYITDNSGHVVNFYKLKNAYLNSYSSVAF